MTLEATTETVSLPNASSLSDKIQELEAKLREAAPGYESLLYTIHKILSADEQLVHILKEEEIGVIVAGLAKKKNIVIATGGSSSSSGGPKKKSLKSMTLDDLI